MIQRRTYIKRLTEAEVGVKETNEIYIRLPNDFDYEEFFQNKGYLNGTVTQIDFQAIDVQNENAVVSLRFSYYANSANKEKRIPSLRQLFESHQVSAGDYAELESITERNETHFTIRFHKADETILKCGKDSQQVYFIQNEEENNPQKLIEKRKNERLDSKTDSYQLIYFGAPGTGKSHQLEEDCKNNFCDSATSIEAHFIDELKNKPEDEKNGSVWLRHIGIKYASFIYNLSKENSNELLQERWSIEKDLLVKLKNTAKAVVDYGHVISNSAEEIGKRYERVTFHPNYSYAQFVGTYKPVQNFEKGKESEILYKYVSGPFMRILVKALQYPEQDFLLIIEEINRANVAAVFGDVFQLLDRKNGVSEYPIAASEDIKKYLKDNGIDDCEELRIPNNMYIWATMNSADQGVFPMDTAFKRRWEFEYIGIDYNAEKVANYEIPIGRQADKAKWKVKWDELRRAINDKLISLGINEDKLLGPYFLSESVLESAMDKGVDFVKSFESKVLMYLFEDAAKMKVRQLFKISSEKYIYSEVCKEFEEKGVEVFDLVKFPDVVDIASSES